MLFGGLGYCTGLIDVLSPVLRSVGGWECEGRVFLVVIESSGLIDGTLPGLVLVVLSNGKADFDLGVLALGLKLVLLGTSTEF